MAACAHSVDLLIQHCPIVIQTAPILEMTSALKLPTMTLAIAAADHTKTHNISVSLCNFHY